jgi:hypothetical protein
MRTEIRAGILALWLGIVPLRAGAQPSQIGPELQVNTYTTSGQYHASVAADALGDFVVVWDSYTQDGSADGVFGQRYTSTGLRLGGEFQVNGFTTSYQFGPVVASDAAGNFVVVWASNQQDGDSFGIFGQRYTSLGTPVGGEFQVNTYTTSAQLLPAVATDPLGNFVVVWESAFQDGSLLGIFGQRYSSLGLPLGGEFQVNSWATGAQEAPDVAVDPLGNIVVAWQSNGPDGNAWGIFAQRYNALGLPVGGEFQVNTYTTDWQRLPAVDSDPLGNFTVAWGSTGQDGSGIGIFGQRFGGDGARIGTEFQVNTYATGDQFSPALAVDADGSFVVVWDSVAQDGSDQGVFGRRYDGTGAPVDGEFQVNSYTTSYQRRPSVAAQPANGFVVVWESYGQDGVDRGAFGQRYVQRATTTSSTSTTSTSTTSTSTLSSPLILGRKMLLKDPGRTEAKRRVIVIGRETSTDIGPDIVGDPVTNGATLRVIAKGGMISDETYVLDASGWSTIGNVGFRYLGPTGPDGDPVERVLIKRTANGTALLKAVLKGSVGTQSLDILPPNPGDEGGIILAINGGATYCVSFGGAALGTETADQPTLWKLLNPTGQSGCVTP